MIFEYKILDQPDGLLLLPAHFSVCRRDERLGVIYVTYGEPGY